MEEGSMRADVNVSVRKPGDPFSTRTATKNVNSVRFVMQTIAYEANRTVAVLESGGKLVKATPLFVPDKADTGSMRSSEDASSDSHFPYPSSLQLELSSEFMIDQ